MIPFNEEEIGKLCKYCEKKDTCNLLAFYKEAKTCASAIDMDWDSPKAKSIISEAVGHLLANLPGPVITTDMFFRTIYNASIVAHAMGFVAGVKYNQMSNQSKEEQNVKKQ